MAEPRTSIKVSNYMQQAAHAAEMERAFYNNLVENGWVWDEVLRHWTHPDKPGVSISS